jgi:hypothetical protein
MIKIDKTKGYCKHSKDYSKITTYSKEEAMSSYWTITSVVPANNIYCD